MKSSKFIIEQELAWEPAGEGVVRQILGYDGQLMQVKVAFKTGAIGYSHQHFHSQSSMVVSGRFEVTVGGESKILVAGDGFYVEPNVVHGVVCLEEGILIDGFSPARLDFLKEK
ncbi:MAG: cupin domain-containing protein [Bacteroidota bacterium]|nr:cupin domain-containing protein [Bacteroidota bacterium]